MTTQSWSTVIDHSSDAAFRTWGSELQSKLLAAGLSATADTGQINWTTVTRAGANSDAGYEIYTFPGALQATAPIYVKFYYGTGGTTAAPRIRVEIGTGSNGSGTITGTAKTSVQTVGTNNAPSSTITARPSYLCATNGHLMLAWKCSGGTANLAEAGFVVTRTCDPTGAASGTGVLCIFGASASAVPQSQALAFSPARAFTTVASGTSQCLVPGGESNSLVGSDNQAYLYWGLTPQVAPFPGLCAVFAAEVAEAATFSATLVGATSHTYISIGRELGLAATADLGALSFGLASIWE